MFRNRYGVDKFSNAIIIASVVFSIIGIFLPNNIRSFFVLISTFLIAYSIYRMFSRNFAARNKELVKYLNLKNRFTQWWRRFSKRCGQELNIKDRLKYKYYSCPRCLQRLRVPKGKGRIRIICNKCGNKFEAKS